MACPYCHATQTSPRRQTTSLGYRTFRCGSCRRALNERTGTPFNFLAYPTDIVLLVVLWQLRYKLSLRDLAEMFLIRRFVFTHETVREWEARFAQRAPAPRERRATCQAPEEGWSLVVCGRNLPQ